MTLASTINRQLIQIPVSRSCERSDRSKTGTGSDTKQVKTVSTWRQRWEGAAAGSDRRTAEAAFFMAMVAGGGSSPVASRSNSGDGLNFRGENCECGGGSAAFLNGPNHYLHIVSTFLKLRTSRGRFDSKT